MYVGPPVCELLELVGRKGGYRATTVMIRITAEILQPTMRLLWALLDFRIPVTRDTVPISPQTIIY